MGLGCPSRLVCHLWFTAIGFIVYGYVQIENRITDLESRMGLANTQIEELISKHIIEENAKMAELEEQLKWYQKELNLNPLSKWRKKK